ncbi:MULTISPECIES: integron-associated HEPN domain-containing protein [Acinetobacter]|uniref:integron-associated HEPN domain-containing protein n=1 Tax=Acinetobacter TaxID=469 RepID=UPI001F4AB62D|nr:MULTISPECIES: integron-associated HEPN domain-containing protein [Acinetobacter]MCH7311797.1 integron-associated HEPN domain-containing protein [Acinetobacter sp. ANC 4805]MCH7329349.1 integron-associated HEPN domain-containing protein [Acinetobacter modestus]
MNTSSEDNSKLSQLFYYLQDISLELQADFAIIGLVEATLEARGFDSFIEYEGLITTEIKSGNPNTINTMAKVAFHNIILNICRFAEAIQKSGCGKLLRRYCPNSQIRFNKFISEYYTDDIKKYRNCYATHPMDDNTKDFTPRSELISLCEKILGISSLNNLKILDFIRFLKRIHHIDEKNPDISLVWAIYEMSLELEKSGIALNRV